VAPTSIVTHGTDRLSDRPCRPQTRVAAALAARRLLCEPGGHDPCHLITWCTADGQPGIHRGCGHSSGLVRRTCPQFPLAWGGVFGGGERWLAAIPCPSRRRL